MDANLDGLGIMFLYIFLNFSTELLHFSGEHFHISHLHLCLLLNTAFHLLCIFKKSLWFETACFVYRAVSLVFLSNEDCATYLCHC